MCVGRSRGLAALLCHLALLLWLFGRCLLTCCLLLLLLLLPLLQG
jgi:hypothetical protein